MKRRDYVFLILMSLLAVYVWLQDLRWTRELQDVLPALCALPLFAWLASPWNFREHDATIDWRMLAATLSLLLLGVWLADILLLATAWTALLLVHSYVRLESDSFQRVFRLSLLPMLSFPWLGAYGTEIGWVFRTSGAYFTESFFLLSGFSVQRQGMHVFVQNVGLDIEPACAGIHMLDVMLVVGSCVAFVKLGDCRRYWWHLPLLVAMAWIANTLRIISIGLVAVAVGPDFAEQLFHSWGGVVVLCLMFLITTSLFDIQRTRWETA